MAQEVFETFTEAETAWFKIKETLEDEFDDEDDLNRATDDEFFDKYGFELFDFLGDTFGLQVE
jgi:hypothetical protein